MTEEGIISIARAIGYTRGLDRAMRIMGEHGLVNTPAWWAVMRALAAADEAEAAKPVQPLHKPFTVIDGGAA